MTFSHGNDCQSALLQYCDLAPEEYPENADIARTLSPYASDIRDQFHNPILQASLHPSQEGSVNHLPDIIQNETKLLHWLRYFAERIFKIKWYRWMNAYAFGIVNIIQNIYVSLELIDATNCNDRSWKALLTYTLLIAFVFIISLYSVSGFAASYDKDICKFAGIDRGRVKLGARDWKKAFVRAFFTALGIAKLFKTFSPFDAAGDFIRCTTQYFSYSALAIAAIPAGIAICVITSVPQLYMRFGPSNSYGIYTDWVTAGLFVLTAMVKSLLANILRLQKTPNDIFLILSTAMGVFGSIFRFIKQWGFNKNRRIRLTAKELGFGNLLAYTFNLEVLSQLYDGITHENYLEKIKQLLSNEVDLRDFLNKLLNHLRSDANTETNLARFIDGNILKNRGDLIIFKNLTSDLVDKLIVDPNYLQNLDPDLPYQQFAKNCIISRTNERLDSILRCYKPLPTEQNVHNTLLWQNIKLVLATTSAVGSSVFFTDNIHYIVFSLIQLFLEEHQISEYGGYISPALYVMIALFTTFFITPSNLASLLHYLVGESPILTHLRHDDSQAPLLGLANDTPAELNGIANNYHTFSGERSS